MSVDIHLLDVSIRVFVEESIARRLASWYAPAIGSTSGEALVSARLTAADGAYDLDVDGVREAGEGDLEQAVRRLNHEILHAVMRRRSDLFFVHAAVVAIAGRGIVLPGLSQSGKSTLALALIDRGARYLSDELLAYDPVRRLALSVPRALKIRDVCEPWFERHREHFVGRGEGRHLDIARLGADRIGDRVSPALVVLPSWSASGDDRVVPISAGRALIGLTSSALNFGAHREKSIDHLADLSNSVRAATIAWRDPHAAAAAIIGFFEGDAT